MESLSFFGIWGQAMVRFWPVWLALLIVFVLGRLLRRRLGLFGRLFDSRIGALGLGLVLFWVFTAIFADSIAPFEPLKQIAELKRALPGAIDPNSGQAFLFGGDNLGRDLFSRMVYGSRFVLLIAPAATLIAYLVGITLGLPAAWYGGRVDDILMFIANLVLAFPVILLFYLLVTPGIRETAIPNVMAGTFFLFPPGFLLLLLYTRYAPRPLVFWPLALLVLGIGGWLYAGLVFDADPLGLVHLQPNELNIFAAVVAASSPGIFRIVRGLALDIKTRDYVAAGQTRNESPWYLMLWEILPNARGPLIVDACLRIGYTTILLGTLGFFGLGLSPESPDWGSMIDQNRSFLRIVPTIVLPQTIALALLVLGLNLLADGLREESLKD
ncbi:MAG: ABC transporter permease [Thiothrix sp.]|nr:ABC transporter permease [Thiothrix sp.]HPQ95866.1 ABC transporter permease [Thiolinea sp.]